MATFDVPTDDGIVRISATDATEAARLVSGGKGMLLPRLGQPGAAQAPPGVYAQPPAPPDATVYTPGVTAPPAPPEQDMLQPVFDAVLPAVGRFAGRAALPMAGSLALGVGGQAVPGLSALPPQIREGMGSMLGTGANMLLGIEEPSLEQLLLSGMVPASTRGAARMATGLLPGAAAGRATGLVGEAQQLPGILAQGLDVEPGMLFAEARRLNPRLTLEATADASRRLLTREGEALPGLKFSRVQKVAQELTTIAKRNAEQRVTEVRLSPILDDLGRPIAREEVVKIVPGTDGRIPLAQLDTVRQRIGALIGVVRDPEERAAYRTLYGGILSDIEEAAATQGGEGARTLIQGIQGQRRAFAAEDLQTLLTAATSQPRPVDGLQTVNFGRIIKTLEQPRTSNEELLSGFLDQHPVERQEILGLLRDMNRRNVKLLPPAGTMFGSGVALARGGAGYLAARGVNAMLGTEIDPGIAAAATTFGSQLISRALLTPAGRGFLRQAYASGPTINVTQLLFQLAGQGVRGSLGPAPVSGAADAVGLGGSTPP